MGRPGRAHLACWALVPRAHHHRTVACRRRETGDEGCTATTYVFRGPIQNRSRPKGGDCRCTLQSVDHQSPARARPMVSVPHRVPARRFSNPARFPSPDVAPVIIVQTRLSAPAPCRFHQYSTVPGQRAQDTVCAGTGTRTRTATGAATWRPWPAAIDITPFPMAFPMPRICPSTLALHAARLCYWLAAGCWLQHHRRTALPKTAHPRITLGINFPCVRADEMSDEDGPANPPPSIQPTKSLEASKLNQP
jgi:hypothetical protein